MQELRLLLISLATVLLSSILLFIYFKTRISKVEEKLEIMFNLIQSHAQEKQLSAEQFVPYGNNSQNSMENSVQSNRVNLIDVSDNDDDDETDSDDSETDSDDEESELVIDNNSLMDSEDNIKKIELSVDNKDVLFDNYLNQENLNNLEEHDTEIIVQKEEVVESDKQFEAEETEEEEETEEAEETEEEVEEEQIDLTKLKVVELRKLCSETGKTGYKSLKKQELINLLMN